MDNIIILFTNKAEDELENLIKKFNLEESIEDHIKKRQNNQLSNIVLIDNLAKSYTLGDITEKDVSKKLQQEAGVDQQTSEQITKGIIEKIVPLLEKVEKTKLTDNDYTEKLYKKISDIENYKEKNNTDKVEDIFPKIKPEEITAGDSIDKAEKAIEPNLNNTDSIPVKKSRPKKVVESQPEIVQKTTTQKSGPDNYRESIE